MEFKFDMEYRIGNRKVTQREWERHLFKEQPRQIVKEHMEALAARARGVVCPEHGAGGVTAAVVQSGDSYDVHTECCCEASAALVQAAAES